MAIGTGNPCKINEPDDELPEVKTKRCCWSNYITLMEFLQSTVLRCENPVNAYDPESQRDRNWETDSLSESAWELACAYGRPIHNRDFSFSTTDGSATVVQLNVVVFSTTKTHPMYSRRN